MSERNALRLSPIVAAVPIRAAVAILLVGILAAPAALHATPSGDDEDEERQQTRRREYVFVEADYPYVPGSNTIATKLPLSMQRTPFNVGAVTEALFDEQFGLNVSDALRNVSNLNVQPQAGTTDFFLIRGFDSVTSGLVLTDGAPEPEATFYHLYNVDVVEVLKGPGGFLYGSNPMAGAVNLVREQPVPSAHLEVGGSVGRYDHFQGTADFNYAGPGDEYLLRVNALLRDAGHFREGRESRFVAVNPALTWNPDEATRLNLNFEFVDVDVVPDTGVPIFNNRVAPVPREQSFQSPFDTSQQEIFRLQADYERTLSEAVTIRNKAYLRDLDWRTNGTLINGVFPRMVQEMPPRRRLVVSRSLTLLDDAQSFLGNQLEGIFTFRTGIVDHHLLGGIEAARLADDFSLDVMALPPLDLQDPVETAERIDPRLFIPGASSRGEARTVVLAPYVVDQMSFGDRFQLLLGGRLDVLRFDDDLRDFDRDDEEFSPMVGATYAVTDEVSLYGNFSRAFAPPSPRVRGDRVPEESTQWEGGAKFRMANGDAQATVALYRLERENIPIPDDNGFTQQMGNQRSQGVELEVVADILPGLRGIASFALNDAELTEFTEQIFVFDPRVGFRPVVVDRSGNDPTFAPEHIVDFWLSKSFADGSFGLPGSLGIAGGGRFVGEQFIAEDNRFIIDSATTFDAALFWSYGEVAVRLNVRNLSDEEFLQRGFGPRAVIPSSPPTVFLGIDYRR